MSRMLFVSTDGHAGLLPGEYRDYLDPQYREAYDADVAVQLEFAKENRKVMLVEEINAKWRRGIEQELTGAWDQAQRIKVMDSDGIAAEVIFPDGTAGWSENLRHEEARRRFENENQQRDRGGGCFGKKYV